MTAASLLLAILSLALAICLLVALRLGTAKERDLKLANEATAELVAKHARDKSDAAEEWDRLNRARIAAENERDVLLAKENKPAHDRKPIAPRTGTAARRAAEARMESDV